MPVLVTPDRSIGESEEILEWVDARTPPEFRLQPADPAAKAETTRLTRRFDAVLGPHGRRLMYVNMLQQRDLMLPQRISRRSVTKFEEAIQRFNEVLEADLDGIQDCLVRPYQRKQVYQLMRCELEWCCGEGDNAVKV